MRKFKRWVAALTALMLAVMPLSAFAAEENTPKEEVVYINLDAAGSVEEINVVNIFGKDTGDNITDYGKYLSVRNMTTTDDIDYSGDIVKINSSAEKLYYEGKLDSVIMPWNIEIQYFLDGKEYSSGEIAGKTGALKIGIRISQNQKCRGISTIITPCRFPCHWIRSNVSGLLRQTLRLPMLEARNSLLTRFCPVKVRT